MAAVPMTMMVIRRAVLHSGFRGSRNEQCPKYALARDRLSSHSSYEQHTMTPLSDSKRLFPFRKSVL